MSKSCLSSLNCLCKCFLLCTNIMSIIMGVIFVLIGAVLAFLLDLLSNILSATLEPMLSSFTQPLKEMGLDIDISEMLSSVSEITGSVGWAFLALGVILIVLSCIGCCGTCCTVRGCLIIYAVIVGVMLLGQIVVISIWFSSNNLFKAHAKSAMKESLKKFTGICSKNIQSLLQNIIQMYMGCCGVTNGTDFETMSPDWNRTYSHSGFTFNLSYPLSCCKYTENRKIEFEYCPFNDTRPETSNYQKGCYDAITDFLKIDYLFYGIGSALIVQILLIVGAVIVLAKDDKNGNKVKPT